MAKEGYWSSLETFGEMISIFDMAATNLGKEIDGTRHFFSRKCNAKYMELPKK